MQIIKKISVYRLNEKMKIGHDVLSCNGEMLAAENEIVTKELKDKLIRNFIEEVYVYTEQKELSAEAYDMINKMKY